MPTSVLPSRPLPDGDAPRRRARRFEGAQTEPKEIVSIWLYLAGLCVTLSGLYAVNFGLEEPGFVMTTYTLAISGYLVSYVLRVLRVSLQAIQIPLMVCLGLIFFAALSSEQGLAWFAPPNVVEDKAKGLQLIFVYMAIIHCFLLSSDGAVLFACVPCMTMLALVSTQSSEPQIQNAFLVFIAASTFLMVHENYLRTRNATLLGKSAAGERRLFGGQLKLTAVCVLGALALANVVAVPIRTVGQSLFIPGSYGAPSNQQMRQAASSTQRVAVMESDSIELGPDAGAQSETEVMRVRSERGLYLRGATFDYYTGHSFKRTADASVNVTPRPEAPDPSRQERDYANFYAGVGDGQRGGSDVSQYEIPFSPLELPASEMQGSTLNQQTITMVGGLTDNLYGAAKVEIVLGAFSGLKVSDAGKMTTPSRLPSRSAYRVLSRVVDDDPDHLRAASSDLKDVPRSIAQLYLQKRPADQTENAFLRDLVAQITKGKKNNYDKVAALRDYVADSCKYNLRPPIPPSGRDGAEYFLSVSKQGSCREFSVALTVLCRYAGVPARLASGFQSGDQDRDGTYVVKEKHKHAWTEAFFPKIGWMMFDATEGADPVPNAEQNKGQNNSFLAWLLSSWIPRVIGVIILALIGYVLKTEVWDRFRPRRRGAEAWLSRPQTNLAVIEAYGAACEALAKRGLARPAEKTPEEYRQWLEERARHALPGLAAPLERLTILHARCRYGREVASEDDARSAQEAAEEIRHQLAQVKRGALLAPAPSPA